MEPLCEDCNVNETVNFLTNPHKHKKQQGLTKWGHKAVSVKHSIQNDTSSDSGSDEDCKNNKIVSKKTKVNSEVIKEFGKKVSALSKSKMPFYRPIELLEYNRTLFEAMIFPELSKGIKFPARKFNYNRFSLPDPHIHLPAEELLHHLHQRLGQLLRADQLWAVPRLEHVRDRHSRNRSRGRKRAGLLQHGRKPERNLYSGKQQRLRVQRRLSQRHQCRFQRRNRDAGCERDAGAQLDFQHSALRARKRELRLHRKTGYFCR